MKDKKISIKERRLFLETLNRENQELKNKLAKAEIARENLRRMIRDLTYSYGEEKGVKKITIEFESGKNEEDS